MATPRIAMLIALLCGAISHLAFAPYDIWPLLPLSLTALLWLSQRASPKHAALMGLSYGFGQFAFGLRWVHVSIDQFGGLPLVVSLLLMALLCLYLALYPALVMGLLNRYFNDRPLSRVLAFPALWLLAEWARGWMLTGFPWLWLGYSQTEGPLTPLIPYLGVLGVGLLLSLLAAALVPLLARRWGYLGFPAAIALMAAGAALMPPKVTEHGSVDVALVQGNIEQSLKWRPEMLWPTLLKYQDLSRPHMDADMVIWPEAAVPAPETMVSEFLHQFERAVAFRETEVITGIISMDEQEHFFNSLLVLGPGEHNGPYSPHDANRYHKHQLLPIGEFVPMEDWLRPLAPFFNLPMSSFNRGGFVQPNLTVANQHLTPAICYEIAFPELVRANVHDNTNLLLTVSNDAWFGDSIGPHQHMAIAQMRALELGRPLLRVTNNGITAIVDVHGHIQAQLPQFETGVLREIVPLQRADTPFREYGQRPLYYIAATLLFLAWRWRRDPN
ncbi:apolipoprotein N-acyltransferase [Ferrimonas balearica]|uniref:apolipoprotein N-acyltransferase n=1 Tax=Ferrimonas balearica TaxID=44012 RepID=UPI001C96219F|nr:apolipoprotein N-acyltransferase [Ferrimonas balearica]MBY6106935.1 apolipoprotein N-acyltransferase [Ferrimonas balearica]